MDMQFWMHTKILIDAAAPYVAVTAQSIVIIGGIAAVIRWLVCSIRMRAGRRKSEQTFRS